MTTPLPDPTMRPDASITLTRATLGATSAKSVSADFWIGADATEGVGGVTAGATTGGGAAATAGGAARVPCASGEDEASEADSSVFVRVCAPSATGSTAAAFAFADTGLVG